jgi:hypothetical protein
MTYVKNDNHPDPDSHDTVWFCKETVMKNVLTMPHPRNEKLRPVGSYHPGAVHDIPQTCTNKKYITDRTPRFFAID